MRGITTRFFTLQFCCTGEWSRGRVRRHAGYHETVFLLCIFFARESGLGRGVRRHAGYLFVGQKAPLGGPITGHNNFYFGGGAQSGQ